MLRLNHGVKVAKLKSYKAVSASLLGVALALTTLPLVPTYAAEQHEFVMPTAKIKVGNPNYLSRIEGGYILNAVKNANKQGVEKIELDEANGKIVITYTDKQTIEKALSEFKGLLEEDPRQPIIRNGGQNLMAKDYVQKDANKKNTVKVYRGDSTVWSVDACKDMMYIPNQDKPKGQPVLYDFTTNQVVKGDKPIVTESFKLTNDESGKNILTQKGLPDGWTFSYKSNKNFYLNDALNAKDAVRVYKVNGTAALNAKLHKSNTDDNKITYTITLKDGKSISGDTYLQVYPQSDKYEPQVQYGEGKSSIEINKADELTVEKVKSMLKFQKKNSPADTNFANVLVDLPEGATVTIVGKIDPNKRGEEQEVEVKVTYKDDQNGDSTDSLKIKVKLKHIEPGVVPNKPSLEGTPQEVEPNGKEQETGLTVKNKTDKTTVKVTDKNNKDVPATIGEDGKIKVTPADGTVGPLKVVVTNDTEEVGTKEVPVKAKHIEPGVVPNKPSLEGTPQEVEPNGKEQETGLTVKNKTDKTTVKVTDKNNKDVPATIGEDGKIKVTPADGTVGPLKVVVTNDTEEVGTKEVPVKAKHIEPGVVPNKPSLEGTPQEVEPNGKEQETGLTVKNKTDKTTVKVTDKNNKDVPATIGEDGKIKVTPADGTVGPLKVVVTNDTEEVGTKEVAVKAKTPEQTKPTTGSDTKIYVVTPHASSDDEEVIDLTPKAKHRELVAVKPYTVAKTGEVANSVQTALSLIILLTGAVVAGKKH